MDSEAVSTVTPATSAAPLNAILRAVSVPAIGTHWIEQGGVFVGIARGIDGGPDQALIIAADPRGHFEDREWGEYPKDVPGAVSPFNGYANTVAMAEAGSALAHDIRTLDIAGFTDWYLPSQSDLQLARANVSELFVKADWYWTSTQYSPRNAWVQDFEDGHSLIGTKDSEFRAVAVRRLVL